MAVVREGLCGVVVVELVPFGAFEAGDGFV